MKTRTKKNPFNMKPEKSDFSLLETFISSDEKTYVFLVKNRQNVRSFIVFDVFKRTFVRYLVRDVSRAARRDLENYFKIVPYLEGARALSSLLEEVARRNEDES